MRHLLVRGAVAVSVGCLGACAGSPRTSTMRTHESSMVQPYGSLAAGDEVGRAAFRTDAAGQDRMVSVPITFED